MHAMERSSLVAGVANWRSLARAVGLHRMGQINDQRGPFMNVHVRSLATFIRVAYRSFGDGVRTPVDRNMPGWESGRMPASLCRAVAVT
jgi:hypothetical protein